MAVSFSVSSMCFEEYDGAASLAHTHQDSFGTSAESCMFRKDLHEVGTLETFKLKVHL